MIEFKKGNIFEQEVQTIVNPVNCVGIMGKGLALQFKERFFDNYIAYKQVCDRHELIPGKLLVTDTGMMNHTYIINFPTKRHWQDKSRIEDIDLGLAALAKDIITLEIKSIAIPALGCGNGGLSWRTVKHFIQYRLKDLKNVAIIVLESKE